MEDALDPQKLAELAQAVRDAEAALERAKYGVEIDYRQLQSEEAATVAAIAAINKSRSAAVSAAHAKHSESLQNLRKSQTDAQTAHANLAAHVLPPEKSE